MNIKRVVLFLATNLAVMLVLSVVASLLGFNRYYTSGGLHLGSLLGFAMVMGATPSAPASACRKWRFTRASPTPSPLARRATTPWWRCPPACCTA